MYAFQLDKNMLGLGNTPSLKAKLQRAQSTRKHPSAYRHGPSENTLRDALAMIQNGCVYVAHTTDEGDAENGPVAFTYVGYRWGQMKMEIAENGMVYLIRDRQRGGYPERWNIVHDSGMHRELWYRGTGAMIADHMRALRKNIERNGTEFVMSGKRTA